MSYIKESFHRRVELLRNIEKKHREAASTELGRKYKSDNWMDKEADKERAAAYTKKADRAKKLLSKMTKD